MSMSTNQAVSATSLYSKEQELLVKLEAYSPQATKTEKLEQILEFFRVDRTQTILKFLASQVSNQTAFSLVLWLISGDLIALDWIYDTAYKISTDNTRIPKVAIKNLYFNSSSLTPLQLSAVVSQTEAILKTIKLDEVDPKKLAESLEPELAISLLTWLLSFRKVTLVDLNNIAEITRKFSGQYPSVPEPTPPASVEQEVEPSTRPEGFPPVREASLEDLLLALNHRQGGDEEQILCRTLDIFLFMKTLDPETGLDTIVYKPDMQVSQYLSNGQDKRTEPVSVASTNTWSPGVYLLQKHSQDLKIMRLPGCDYFELFPEGPDPYMRALTIQSTTY
jgi:hypothetical protein